MVYEKKRLHPRRNSWARLSADHSSKSRLSRDPWNRLVQIEERNNLHVLTLVDVQMEWTMFEYCTAWDNEILDEIPTICVVFKISPTLKN